VHHVLARITFKPDAIEAGRKIMTDLVEQSRHDKGCMAYALYQQADAPHVFQTVEDWDTQADADAHMATAHVGAAIAAGMPLFATPPEILAFAKVA
jgi:quinol monooxygenase YgiN